MKHHNTPAALLSAPLADALAAGITFKPLESPPGAPGHLDVEVHQALANKATVYRLRLGTALYYPTAGKQPTKAQLGLIDPVLRTVAIYSVPGAELAALADPLNIPAPPAPEEPKGPSVFEKIINFPVFTVLAFVFLPFYLIFSLVFQTAKKYDGS